MNHQPVKRLQGAALKAAIVASEKQLGPAEIEVERIAGELEALLIAGKDTSDIRAALNRAIKTRDRLGDEHAVRLAQVEQRRAERIVAAAQALVAAANNSTSALLQQFEFAL
jgi:hypothetical protein